VAISREEIKKELAEDLQILTNFSPEQAEEAVDYYVQLLSATASQA
jgi:hypothetical protein